MKKFLLLFLIFGVLLSAMPIRVEAAASSCHDTLLGCTDKQSDRCPSRKKCPNGKYQDPAYYLHLPEYRQQERRI